MIGVYFVVDLKRAYKTLEIPETSTMPEVRQAYRDMVQVWHPDRHSQNERLQSKSLEKMKEINAAYDCICRHLDSERATGFTDGVKNKEPDITIVACPQCGVRNRVPASIRDLTPKCGRCGNLLFPRQKERESANGWEIRIFCGDGTCTGIIDSSGRCTECGKTFEEGRARRREGEQNQHRLRPRYKTKIYASVAAALLVLLLIDLYSSWPPKRDRTVQQNSSRQESMRHDLAAPPSHSPKKVTESVLINPNRPGAGVAPPNPIPASSPAVKLSIPEQPLPPTGDIVPRTTAKRVAPFEIKAAKGSHHLVKLVDAYTKADVLTVFVRGGTTANVDVPLGTFEIRYASGEKWCGFEHRFGPETAYSKADKTFTFEINGNQVSGFSVTLYKVPHGNLSTSSIKPTEF